MVVDRRVRGSLGALAAVLALVACGGTSTPSVTTAAPASVSPCLGFSPPAGATSAQFVDFDAARAAGLLTPALDVARVAEGADIPTIHARISTLFALRATLGGLPDMMNRAAAKLVADPYGPADARCALSVRTDSTAADLVALTTAGAAVATSQFTVVPGPGVAVVSPAGYPTPPTTSTDGPASWAPIGHTFAVDGLRFAEVLFSSDGTAATAVATTGNATGAGPLTILWWRPDLADAKLLAAARAAVSASSSKSVVDPTKVAVTAAGHLATITVPSADAATTIQELVSRSDPLLGGIAHA